MSNEFHTINDVCDRIKVSPATIYRWIKIGNFPAPVKLNGGAQQSAARWPAKVISDWVNQKCGVA